jgi:hypothetical protein
VSYDSNVICPTCLKAKTVAEQLAAKLNTKLNYQPKEEDDKAEEEQVETFRKYEEELEINDFPQQARWRVTSKVSIVFCFVTKSIHYPMKFTYVIDRYSNMYLCELNERSTFHVLKLHFKGYVFRNTHTTGKLKDIDSDYEAQCEAESVGFVTWLLDLSCVSGFTL